MSEEYYTKLFVRTEASHDELLRLVIDSSGGARDGSTVIAKECEFDVRPNSEGSERAWGVERDAFLYFPYTVDAVGSAASVGLEPYLSRIRAVMEALHGNGMAVVAACDWEGELPGAGRLL